MTLDVHDVPARLRPVLSLLMSGCRSDERVRSAWLEGSFAVGLEDEWSDIDLHLLVDGAEAFEAISWLRSLTPLVLEDAIPGLSDAYICLTPEWVHIDLVVHSRADELDQHTARRMLLDKDASSIAPAPNAVQARPHAPMTAWFPQQQIQIFLYFMGTAVASFHRGDVIALAQTTATMRDRLLVQLMLAENGLTTEPASKRLTGQLSEEQLACLQRLPALALDEVRQRDALRAIATVYLTRAQRLATKCRADWPTGLEQATKRLWSDELGIDL